MAKKSARMFQAEIENVVFRNHEKLALKKAQKERAEKRIEKQIAKLEAQVARAKKTAARTPGEPTEDVVST